MKRVTDQADDWKSDWKAFVKRVAHSFDEGLDDEAVSERFAGQPVTWAGTVADKRLDERPGIQLDMPPVQVALSDARRATVDYLFLRLREADIPSWRNIKIGSIVRFTTQIRRSIGPFSGIRWSDTDDKHGIIMLATDGAVPVESAVR